MRSRGWWAFCVLVVLVGAALPRAAAAGSSEAVSEALLDPASYVFRARWVQPAGDVEGYWTCTSEPAQANDGALCVRPTHVKPVETQSGWVYPDPVHIQWALDNVAMGGTVFLEGGEFLFAQHTELADLDQYAQVGIPKPLTLTGEQPTLPVLSEDEIPSIEKAGRWPTRLIGGNDTVTVKSPGVTISNLAFEGYGAIWDNPWGAVWLDIGGVSVEHCAFLNPYKGWSYGIGLGGAGGDPVDIGHNFFLMDFLPDDVEFFSIFLAYRFLDIDIHDNFFDGAGDAVFDFYSDVDGTPRNLTVRDNVMRLVLGHTKTGVIYSAESFSNRQILNNKIFLKPTVNHGRGEAVCSAISISNPDGYRNKRTSGLIQGNLIDMTAPSGARGAIQLWAVQIYSGDYMPGQVGPQNIVITDNTIRGGGEFGIALPDPMLPGEFGAWAGSPDVNEASDNTIADNDFSGFTVRRLNPEYDVYCDAHDQDTSDPAMSLVAMGADGVQKALDFDGSGYVQLPDDLFPYPDQGPFTFATWFRTAEPGVIFGKSSVPYPVRAINGWDPLVYVDVFGGLRVGWWNWESHQVVSGYYDESGPHGVFVTDGAWHHVVMAYDGSDLSVYLDGAALGTIEQLEQDPGYAVYSDHTYYYLGTGQWLWSDGYLDNYSPWTSLVGQIADVRIFRRGVSPEEAAALFDGAIIGNEAAQYTCDQLSRGPLQVLVDDSGNGLDAFVSPHFCTSPASPKYLDGVAHIWLGPSTRYNTVVAGPGVEVLDEGKHNDVVASP